MKKCVGLSLLLNITALLFLAQMASPAFAATQQVNLASSPRVSARVAYEVRRRPHRHPSGQFQQNNQTFVGNSATGNTTVSKGHNQSNTGNQGYNFGHSQDNSINAANQVINQYRRHGNLQNNQHYFGNSDDFNHIYYYGYNQGNTGNQGHNWGDNQDNSTNGGNQIIN